MLTKLDSTIKEMKEIARNLSGIAHCIKEIWEVSYG
nr:MAG TPA: hypothetical protein [Caudoviricetes sp.]